MLQDYDRYLDAFGIPQVFAERITKAEGTGAIRRHEPNDQLIASLHLEGMPILPFGLTLLLPKELSDSVPDQLWSATAQEHVLDILATGPDSLRGCVEAYRNLLLVIPFRKQPS